MTEHCGANKNRPLGNATRAEDACMAPFVELSGDVVGCPVHGIRRSWEERVAMGPPMRDRSKREREQEHIRRLHNVERLTPEELAIVKSSLAHILAESGGPHLGRVSKILRKIENVQDRACCDGLELHPY